MCAAGVSTVQALFAAQTLSFRGTQSIGIDLAFAPAPLLARNSPLASSCRKQGKTQIYAKKSLKEILREEEDAIPNEPLGKNLDPQKEFELNRGLAVDTLLQDYPYILTKASDYSIFRKDVVLMDAQGFSITGLKAYELFFGLLRRLARTLFASASVSVILMDKYAHDKSRIRLRWKVEVNAAGDNAIATTERDMLKKMGFEGNFNHESSSGAILEGISVYKIDAQGMILSHTIEITEPTALSAPLKTLVQLLPSSYSPRLVPDVIPN